LDGIGALQTGILPAGIYKAQGTYSLITDEYRVPDALKSMPAETIEKLKKVYEFKAFLESWQPQWPLQITGDEGWLEPEQRQQVERMLETMKNQQ